MAYTVVKPNAYNFSELTESGKGDTQPLITNTEGRTALPFEIILQATAPFYCGEIREYDGIADDGTGRIEIAEDRVIRTEQMEATDTFVVGAEVFFHPGGSGAAGKIVDTASKLAGDIAFGRCEGFGGAATAHTYIDVRPYAFDSARALET